MTDLPKDPSDLAEAGEQSGALPGVPMDATDAPAGTADGGADGGADGAAL